jgi:hypothetical protein
MSSAESGSYSIAPGAGMADAVFPEPKRDQYDARKHIMNH